MADIISRTLAPASRVVESSVGDETILLNLADSTYYGLDGVGTRIWAKLKAGAATADICHTLAETYGISLAKIETDVSSFLEELLAQGIIVDA